jgi:predicted phage terminase large subunit-like protein
VPVLNKDFSLHPVQAAFCRSPAAFRGFVGGRGAGKSKVGAYDLIRRSRSGRLYQAVAPTYSVLKDATWRSLLDVAAELELIQDLNNSDLRCILRTGAEVIGRSADNPERLRGPNLSGLWLDEASQMDEDVFQVGIACLREGGQQGWMSATFTPKGRRHWTFDVFAGGRPDTELFHARTADNPFLPVEFEGTVRRQYTSFFAAQELGGEFVDPEGSIIRREWLKVVEASPADGVRVRYWDKASTEAGGAYTCGVLMSRTKGGRFFVEDVVRGQWSSGRRNDIMLATAKADRDKRCHAVWTEQEPGSGGKESAESTARLLAGFNVHADRVTGDKVERFQPFAAQAEAGNVFVMNKGWTDEYVDELVSFPEGRYKDQADATAGAFNKLATHPGDWTVGIPPAAERNGFSGLNCFRD